MKFVLLILICFFSLQNSAQDSLKKLLQSHNSHSVPYITVQELAMPKTNLVILDAREQKEYKVSHLKNAIYVGYNAFNIDSIQKRLNDKNEKIVVYCSLGIRSENIAQKLKKAGFKNVFNLYGGIFEWKNNDFAIVNMKGKETDSIHAFSKSWSKWLTRGIKVYE